MAETNSSAYSVLGLPKGSSERDIKNAYVNLVKKFDPEKHTERFMVIQRAYDRLRNNRSRAEEDVYTFNVVRGEYLFQPEEKTDPDHAPDEADLVRARAGHRQDPANEETKKTLCNLLFRTAYYAIRRKQLNEAVRTWTEVLEIDPTHIRARHNLELASAGLGLSYALHGLNEEAIELWENALKMNPDNTALVQNLALAAEKANDPEKAAHYWGELVNRWKQKLEAEQDNEYLRFCIVEALNHHGEYLDQQQKVLERKRATAARQAEAEARAREEQQPAPGASTDSVKRFSSSRVKIPSRQRESQETTQRKLDASASLDRHREIVRFNPDDFDAHYQLCNKLMEEQLWEEAKKELTALTRKHPKNTEVLNLLGWALLNSGQKDLAFNAWKRSLSLDPKNPSTREQLVRAHLSMGKAFRNKGLFTQALVHFKQLLSYMPGNAEVHLEIAATYDMKGDTRSAAQEYNKVLSLDPKNTVARKALNDLRLKR